MLIGRDFKKSVSQLWANLLFRWVALWILVAFCASKGPAGFVAGIVIIAVEIIVVSSVRGLLLVLEVHARKDWYDRLTNRLFYGLLIEEFRAGRGSMLDVDELFKLATKQAIEDINIADTDSNTAAGALGTTSWHWFGGVLSFVGQVIGSFLWYGSALVIGSGG